MTTRFEPNLVLLDSHGVYIPQMYCSDADEHWANCVGVDYNDVLTCKCVLSLIGGRGMRGVVNICDYI